MAHSIDALHLADLVTSATQIAQRTDDYARIVYDDGAYVAVSANAQSGTDVYVVFADGVCEVWDAEKLDEYEERAEALIIE